MIISLNLEQLNAEQNMMRLFIEHESNKVE